MSQNSYILVGPAPPYRGGIANYNSLLAQTLTQNNTVRIVNFSYLYPNFLFPGKTQFLENYEQSDLPQLRKLSSVNPLSWSSTGNYILDQQPDAVIFQWWHPFFAPAYAKIAKKLQRHDIPAIFICHNVEPHESTFIDQMLLRYAYKNVNRFVVHSTQEKNRLQKYKPEAEIKINVHPEYTIFPEPKNDMSPPVQIPTHDLTLLYFGLVRPYKGVHILIDALKKVIGSIDVHLLIVGEFYDDVSTYLEQVERLNLRQQITFVDQYVPNEEVGWYFQQADVVVLPYLHATQSGVIPIAYHFRKPVIATNVGGLPDVVFEGETGFLVEPVNPKLLADKIIEFAETHEQSDFKQGIEKHLELFSWEHLVRTIEELIEN